MSTLSLADCEPSADVQGGGGWGVVCSRIAQLYAQSRLSFKQAVHLSVLKLFEGHSHTHKPHEVFGCLGMEIGALSLS